MKHPLDFTLVAVTPWLLASMIIDALTPKWLTVYMIGAALAPWVLVGIVLRLRNWRRGRNGAAWHQRTPSKNPPGENSGGSLA